MWLKRVGAPYGVPTSHFIGTLTMDIKKVRDSFRNLAPLLLFNILLQILNLKSGLVLGVYGENLLS